MPLGAPPFTVSRLYLFGGGGGSVLGGADRTITANPAAAVSASGSHLPVVVPARVTLTGPGGDDPAVQVKGRCE